MHNRRAREYIHGHTHKKPSGVELYIQWMVYYFTFSSFYVPYSSYRRSFLSFFFKLRQILCFLLIFFLKNILKLHWNMILIYHWIFDRIYELFYFQWRKFTFSKKKTQNSMLPSLLRLTVLNSTDPK